MASIQKMIVQRVQLYIRNEIKKYLRRQNDETRKTQGELAECKRRLLRLEKYADEESEKAIAHCLERLRTNGAMLKTLRKKLGISQIELALLLDSNPATINRWESGKVKLSRKSCETIIKIRSLSVTEARRALQEKYIHRKDS
jgi:DNA-binding transcriptional regulator YiaG